ncbi:MAG: glycosyl transferase group 1, partial [Chitinophagaceae bacterium]|nr:glycosyl transferase group 1 [Chitinophagaceae bacterium]
NYKFIFCIDFFAQFYMALFRVRRKLKFTLVVNLHITIPKKYKDYLINFIAARLLKKTDWVIFISQSQLEYITPRFLFKSTKNTKVIYNGIDTSTYTMVDTATKASLRQQLLTLPDKAKVIIKVAGIRIEKDHETAIKALKFYHESYNDKPYLLILGDGDNQLLKKLHTQATDLGIANYIKFIGFTANVNKYLSCSDVFTLTSNSVETFSLAALEAMACGLPVVLTDIGGAKEMVDEKINGTLSLPHKPENIAFNWYKVSNMNYNREVIREFAVSKFDVAIMNNNYLDFFSQLM